MFSLPFQQFLCARFLTVVLLLSLAACGREQQSFQPPKPKTLTAAELQKLRWIEGSWRGTGVNQPPFFERYRFENDSTLTVDHLEDELLAQWIERMNPVYMAVSLAAEFQFPGDDIRDRLLRKVILPAATEHGLSLTLMVGVRRAVNPDLREAGDGVGRADVSAIERLCAQYPDVRFLVTFLSRENQHELCVAARKFNNLMPFGCWWFLNNPSIVTEITRERLELLGQSFIPQHSDARVLEQLIYKWKHARRQIADALSGSYEQLLQNGRAVTREEIARDVRRMFEGNFSEWVSAV